MGIKYKYLFWICAGLFVSINGLSSQAWTPILKNYTPNSYRSDNYDSSPQNWTIVQDPRGVMYVGNSSGILEYDGRTRRFVPGTEEGLMDRLGVGPDGRIYAGGINNFGYFKTDSTGLIKLVSLMEQVPDSFRNFEVINQVASNQYGAYFFSTSATFRYFEDQLSVLTPTPRLYGGWEAKGRIYIRPWTKEIPNEMLEIRGDSILPAPWEPGIEEDLVQNVISGEGDRLWFITRLNGLILREDGRFKEVDPVTKDLYRIDRTISAAVVDKDHLVVGSTKNGLLVHNENGVLIDRYSTDNWLEDNVVVDTYTDRESAVWLALTKGVSRIKISSAFQKSGEENGMTGLVRSVVCYKDQLFTAGTEGVHQLTKAPIEQPGEEQQEVTAIEALPLDSWGIEVFNGKIITANVSGVFEKNGEKWDKIANNSVGAIYCSRKFPNRLYMGKNTGISFLELDENGDWKEEVNILDVSTTFSRIAEDSQGDLWLNAAYGSELYYVKKPGYDSTSIQIQHFTSDSDLPEGVSWIDPYRIKDNICFGTTRGVFEYSEATNTFIRCPNFSDFFTNGKNEARNFVEDKKGTLWASSLNKVGPLKVNSQGQYDWDSTGLFRIPPNDIWSIYPDSNDILYLATNDGVLRYDPTLRNKNPYSTLVRKVTLGTDSVIFHGAFPGPNGTVSTVQPDFMIPELDFSRRNLTFEYSAPFYDWEDENVFSHKLENYDEEWSVWSYDTKVPYTNLPAGTYTFRVRAKNVYEQVSEEGRYSFTISRPLYATWWAFIIYAILAIAFIYLIVRLNARRLRKRNISLELTIGERTQEIREQKDQLEETNEELKVAKDRAEQSEKFMEQFLANMSHEIRTPMNAVMGMTHLLLDTKLNQRQQKYLNTIKYASDNLLVIINDILDLTKIEVGQMTLESIPFRIRKVADGVVNTVQLKAEEKGLKLIVDFDENLPPVIYGDPFRLNQILLNLVNNAVKFTEEGYVRLAMRLLERENGQVFVRFQVEDSGIGIPEEKLDDIFQSFKQASAETTRKFGGTGLGLTISRHLVELQNGQIDVDSEEDEGTTFGFNLWFPEGTVEELEQEEAADEAELSGDLPPIRLLLVDDDAFNREVGQETLLNWHAGIELEMAENGREALEKVDAGAFDIVLMDMQMPEMDGMEATQAIRKLEGPAAKVPIVALTAHASRKERERCLAGGMNEYLTKPFQPKELFRTILRLLPEEARNRTPVPAARPKESSPEPTPLLSPKQTSQLMNLEILEGISGGDPNRLMKFLDMFDRLSQQEWAVIQEAADSADWDTMRKSAHKLKGQAGYLGIDSLHKLLERIEKFEDPEKEAELLTDLLSQTDEGLKMARAEISEIKNDK